MRAVSAILAVIGGSALALAVAVSGARGDPAGVGWVLIGPAPFYAVGLIAVLRRPASRSGLWLLGVGAMFALETCLGGAVLPVAHLGAATPAVALVRVWADTLGVVAGIGLICTFPTGVPQGPAERALLRVAAVVAVLVPVLRMVAQPAMPQASFPGAAEPVPASPLHVPAAAPLAAPLAWLHRGFVAWSAFGVLLLYLRYRRSSPHERRRIRWLLVGVVAALGLWFAVVALAWVVHTPAFATISTYAWLLTLILALGSLVVAMSHEGVFGIDQPIRRSVAYRVLWLSISVAYLAAVAALGVLAARYLPVGVAVLLATGAALVFQPARRCLERLADRWVFGARLDGYEVLTRLGATLEAAPGPTDLLPRLAEAVRAGLGVRWARVRLYPVADAAPGGADPAPDAAAVPVPAVDGDPGAVPGRAVAMAGAAGIDPDDPAEPALAVPLTHAGTAFGQIECGPRRDGVLLEEDRRLLRHLAGQAATAARNLHLTAELTRRLEVIRSQAAQLSASRARLARAGDAERRRLQRDLHDGVQQELVVATAKLAMARERLRRGATGTDDLLAELQRDVHRLLDHLREFAHAIRPPVLADQGVLEAIEAQAARLPLEVVIEADPALRGVRYPGHVETAAWYLISEALTNAVKHAGARRIHVALSQPNGCLAVEVRDDGRGFDPRATQGLGLAGLSDRMSVVNGRLAVDSAPGRGTALRAEIPLGGGRVGDG